jgi:hypothetical protein
VGKWTMLHKSCLKKNVSLDTVETFWIYKEATDDNHLSEKPNCTPNRIFETIIKTGINIAN